MKPPVDVPRVRDYLRILAGSWLVILCATVLSAIAVAAGARLLQDPVYVAVTRVFAVAPGDAQTHAAYEGNRASTVRMDTYVQLATSTIVTQRTIDELGLDETAEELAERVTAAPAPDTLSTFSFPMSALLDIQVTGGDPNGTRDIANALTGNLVAASREVEWNSSIQDAGPSLVLVDEAKSVQESRSSLLVDAGTGGAIGLGLSCLAVLAIGVRRDRILNRDHVGYVSGCRSHGDRAEPR